MSSLDEAIVALSTIQQAICQAAIKLNWVSDTREIAKKLDRIMAEIECIGDELRGREQ